MDLMYGKAGSINNQKQEDDMNKVRRKNQVEMLERLFVIRSYDSTCVEMLTNSWAKVAKIRGNPDKQTLHIVFSGLEVPAHVIKPIFKVTIMVTTNLTT